MEWQYADQNHDGRYDTAYIDRDGDGNIENLWSDNNQDGIWDTQLLDQNDDGRVDWAQVLNGRSVTWLADPDGDGRFNWLLSDGEGNGRYEVTLYDANGDGNFEWRMSDQNLDGHADTWTQANTVEDQRANSNLAARQVATLGAMQFFGTIF